MKIKEWIFSILILVVFLCANTSLLGHSEFVSNLRPFIILLVPVLYLTYALLQLKSMSTIWLRIGVPLSTLIIVLMIFERMHWPLGPFLWVLGVLAIGSSVLLAVELVKRVMDSFTSSNEVSALGAVIIANGGYMLHYLDIVHFESFIFFEILSLVILFQLVRLIWANKGTPVGQAVKVLALLNIGLSMISAFNYLDL